MKEYNITLYFSLILFTFKDIFGYYYINLRLYHRIY